MRLSALTCFITATALLTTASCKGSNPVSHTMGEPQQRAVATGQHTTLALITLDQGFNDLGRWVVEGRIKNLNYDGEITENITVKVLLYTADGTFIDEETDLVFLRDPREESTFETTSYGFELGRLTPDPDKTVINLYIGGTLVSYEDRTGGTGSDTAGRYDFRWSRWGDSKDVVASKEPGTLTFTRTEGMDETGVTTAVLTFSETISDTVDVTYSFMGNELWSGAYTFKASVTANLVNALRQTLTDRYGISEEIGGNTAWKRNENTWVILYPATNDSNMFLAYVEESMLFNLAGNTAYNALPLRVAVPE